ncbi:Transcription factor TGA like domain [Macleaya cordata]|uniref:Transcription factor TGA like domain n=1 Tax=Macleaya cordata TaxID=56857 RepID=A0A200Q9U0_MACCD|nr:Transcription factor TGA like domain [Macleaya cordata]
MASSSDQLRFRECYQNWMTQQQGDLEELLQVFNQHHHHHHHVPRDDEEKLRLVVEKVIKHFQEYHETRTRLSKDDATSFFSPTWCNSIENSCLWLGGCRPSLSIRLVYSLCGSELESQLNEYLEGVRKGNMGELSATQLGLVSQLQCRTVSDEEKLSKKMASLQEDIADEPLATFANKSGPGSYGDGESSDNGEVDRALDAHARALAGVLDDADKLRMNTLKELIGILKPLQAVDFLIVSKKLHLCIHEWGKRRDLRLGRT